MKPINLVSISPVAQRKAIKTALVNSVDTHLILRPEDFSGELIGLGDYTMAVVNAISKIKAIGETITNFGGLNCQLKKLGFSLVIHIDLDQLYKAYPDEKGLINAIMDMPNSQISELKESHIGLLVFISEAVGAECKAHNFLQFKNLYNEHYVSEPRTSKKRL